MMTIETTRLKMKFGNCEIEYEGREEFLKDEIMPKIGEFLHIAENHSSKLLRSAPLISQDTEELPVEQLQAHTNIKSDIKFNISLASFLKENQRGSSQVKRFLATAAWLYMRGEEGVNSIAIANTLQNHQQNKLANSADCLNKNVAKGLCEKTKEGFFITPEGWQALGLEQ